MTRRRLILDRLAPEGLASAAGQYLATREAQHSFLLGLADRMRSQPHRFADAYVARVRHDDETRLVAARTPPFHLLLSVAGDMAAIDLIADDLVHVDEGLLGVNAPIAEARRFVAAWTARTRHTAVLDMRTRVFQLEEVQWPVPMASGQARFATLDDAPRLAAWVEAFRAEAVPNDPRTITGADVAAGWLSRPEPVVWLWIDEEGEPVSMAVAGGKTPHGVRIGGVYTPPAHRRRGYASALVASASQGELDRGRTACFLDADLANGTSNRIYQAIGYVPVGDVEIYRFVPGQAAARSVPSAVESTTAPLAPGRTSGERPRRRASRASGTIAPAARSPSPIDRGLGRDDGRATGAGGSHRPRA